MIEVPLLQRTQTPGITPPPKPSYQLADRSGEINFLQTVSRESAKLLGEYLSVRAANEESTFLGQVYAEEERFRGWLTANPNAKIEQIQTEQRKLITNLETAGTKLTLPASQQYAKNWLAKNKGRIFERTTADINAIGLEREVKLFNLNLDAATREGRLQDALDMLDRANEAGLMIEGELELRKQQVTAEIEQVVIKQAESDALQVATQIRNVKGDIDLVAANKFIDETKLPAESELKVMKKLNEYNTQEKNARQQQQYETGKQALLDLWDGKLTTDGIEDLFEQNLITDTKAKELRKALLNPERDSDLQALGIVNEAILDLQTGAKTRDEAIKILYANASKLSTTDGKSKLNEIYGDIQTVDSGWKKQAMSYMEEYIRDKDPFSGLFTDDEQQIAASMQAKLELDELLERQKREGKPITGRDIVLKAHGIAWATKRRMELTPEGPAEQKLPEGLKTKQSLTMDAAVRFLELADGDRKKAEELAIAAGYYWK